jgi:hypothetical protein
VKVYVKQLSSAYNNYGFYFFSENKILQNAIKELWFTPSNITDVIQRKQGTPIST